MPGPILENAQLAALAITIGEGAMPGRPDAVRIAVARTAELLDWLPWQAGEGQAGCARVADHLGRITGF